MPPKTILFLHTPPPPHPPPPVMIWFLVWLMSCCCVLQSQTVTDHQEVSVVELRMRTKVGELQESIRMKLISFIIVEALLVMWSIWVMFWYLAFQMTHLIGVLVCTGELLLMVTVWSIHYRRADPQLLYGRFACTWDEDQALELDQQECADKAALSHSPTSEKEECIPHPEHRVRQPSLGPSPAVSEPEITMDTELWDV